jgi:6-phosphogluconolactonase (cycloisomerase 2 family)
MLKAIRGLSTIAIGIGCLFPAMLASAQIRGTETFFVMSNNADKNQVIEFVHTSDGTVVAKETFDTKGRGTGGVNDPLESQGSLTLSADHSLLFAANAGSGDITVFRVIGGRLIFLNRQPSGGSNPVAIAQSQNRVYVLNQGGAGSVVGFQMGFRGQLLPIANSTAFLSANAVGGSSISISPDGQTLAVAERLTNNIDTFHINPNGTLGPIVVNPSPGVGAFSGRFAPDGKLIVSETGSTLSAISSYTVNSNGKLSAVTQSLTTNGHANCWNAITPNGAFVYASNAGSSNISGFSIGQSGALTALTSSSVVASNPENATNLDITISGDGKFFYSLNATVGTVGVFAIQSNGTLTEVDEIPGFTAAVGFNGIAAL